MGTSTQHSALSRGAMSLYSDILGGVGWDVMAAAAGLAATYTPAGGTAKTITLVPVTAIGTADVAQDDGQSLVEDLAVTISADATAGISEPAIDDLVAIGARTYAVIEVLDSQAGIHELRLRLFEATEKSGPGHRLERRGR